MRFEYADSRLPVAMISAGINYYLTYDQVGSLRVVADASGNVIKRIDYDSFGNIISDSNPGFDIPFGFVGGMHDRNTGLVRFGFRDYDPEVGRWTAKDPIGFRAGSVDLYGYCLNDPLRFIDPDGLWIPQAIGGVIGAGFGAYTAIASGQSFSGVLQSALVGGLAGVLSTIPIPGINPLLSGVIMGAGAGFLGNIAAQVISPDPCAKGINWESAGLSALAGGIGGFLGSSIAGVTSRQNLPIFTEFAEDVISSTTSGITAGVLDALLR